MAKKKKTLQTRLLKAAVLYLLHKRIVRKEKKKAEQLAAQGRNVRVSAISLERILYRAIGGRKTARMNAKIVNGKLRLAKGKRNRIGEADAVAVNRRSRTGNAGTATWKLVCAVVRKMDTPVHSGKSGLFSKS